MKAREINQLAEEAMQAGGQTWFMGYVRPMSEFKAHAELNRRGLFAYLPLEKKKRKVNGWRQAPSDKRYAWVDTPAFSGTVFFAIDRAAEWFDLRNPQIFTRFAQDTMTGRAARISAAEMAAYIGRNKDLFADGARPAHPFKVGDVVQTVDAAMMIEAEIKAIRGQRARIETELFGARHEVEIQLDNLAQIT